MTFTIANIPDTDITISTITVTSSTSWDLTVVSKFSHGNFWATFVKKHTILNQKELLTIICDVARVNFGPKPENWPGVTVTFNGTVGAGNKSTTVVLEKGQTKVMRFMRGIGETWTWTAACLATAGLFKEIYHSDNDGRDACSTIFGNSDGYTQFCGTIRGWSQDMQDSAENLFETANMNAGNEERDPKVTAKVKAAAASTIKSRSDDNCALGVRNVMRICSGLNLEVDDNPIITAS